MGWIENIKRLLPTDTNHADNFNAVTGEIENNLNEIKSLNTALISEVALKANIADINTLTVSKADKTYVDTLTASIANGSPKGTYATVTDLATAFPTGNSNIYVVTADGNWYYWNSTAWTSGGVYQSTGLLNESVNPSKITKAFDLLEIGTVIDNSYIYGYNESTREIGYGTNGGYFMSIIKVNKGKVKINLSTTASSGTQLCLALDQEQKVIPASNSTYGYLNLSPYVVELTSSYCVIDLDKMREAFSTYNFTYIVLCLKKDITNRAYGIDVINTSEFEWLSNQESYNVSIHLQDTYTVCVGKQMNFYYDNFIQTTRPNDIYYAVTSTLSSFGQKDNQIQFTPTASDIGTKTITIKVKAFGSNKVLATKTININVLADTPLTTAKKVMFIGDSLTNAGTIQGTVKEMFGSNLILYGTLTDGTYNNEGRSGFSAYQYVSTQSYNGFTNAFYNPSTSTFDFAYYITNNPNFSDVNVVNIFLGRNDGYESNFADYIDIIIASIHSYNPNIIVTVMTCYNTAKLHNGNIATDEYRASTFIGNTYLYSKFSNRESEKIYIVPSHLNLDTLYDFPHTTEAVSARNPETKMTVTDLIHPNSYGYKKMADVWYSYFQDIIN
jgi:hypothetical protein